MRRTSNPGFLPHVFEADDGMSARVECYDPVEQKVLFEYHYHCYGDKNGPPRYANYPCETVGCLGQGLGAAETRYRSIVDGTSLLVRVPYDLASQFLR